MIVFQKRLAREISTSIVKQVTENGMSEQEAWNNSTVNLLNLAKLYISIFVLECNLNAIVKNNSQVNRTALADVFELFVLYEIVDVYSASFLKVF